MQITRTQMRMHTCAYGHANSWIHMHTYTPTRITCTCVCKHRPMCEYMQTACENMPINTNAHMHAHLKHVCANRHVQALKVSSTCMCACKHTHPCTRTHNIYAHKTGACVHAFKYTPSRCVYVYVQTPCTHLCTHIARVHRGLPTAEVVYALTDLYPLTATVEH